MPSQIPLVLFAKAPQAGLVKTRLHSHCSPEQAAEIAKILLQQTIEKIHAHWPGEVVLSVWPNQQDPYLQQLAKRYQLAMTTQASGDLGEKMAATFDRFGYPAAIIGSDAPHVLDDSLIKAHQLLESGANVIGPSEDGGYYLIGLQQVSPVLFTDVAWGEDTVLATTLDRSQQQNSKIEQLAWLNDVDTWADLVSVASLIPTLTEYLHQEKLL